MNIRHLLSVGALLVYSVTPLGAEEANTLAYDTSPSPTLTLKAVLRQVEASHPLLRGTQTERQVASGKLLTALGQFEPNLVNDWELERLVKNGETTSVGFNDTIIEMRHPWGISGFAGFRAGIGDVEVADLGIKKSNQRAVRYRLPSPPRIYHEPSSCRITKIFISE